ncbi:formate dehydrogenase subunit gamma [Arenibaculum sp.]|uniref:formate dehydrogenase subunit gamma n=1 Tax=Arenibaculum sp. TaxID=2865862 RepID=UPI002E0F7C89|nr:formate dehydrogenase subunit gamma [Arenibaculum sp.]
MPRIRAFAPVAAFLLALLLAAPALAQVEVEGPGAGEGGTVAPGLELPAPEAEPPAADVQLYMPEEDQLIGRLTIPNRSLATLVQPEGRTWRAFRMETLFWIAGIVILGTLAALAAFYFWRGTIRIDRGRSDRWVPRFNGLERFAHWTTALSFIALALTGLIVTFGRFLLIPLMGHDAFTATSEVSKNLHNFSSVPFVLGLVLMLALWIRDNLPTRADLVWLKHGGGMFSRNASFHPESGRFNAGQKGIFWAVVLGGIAMTVTGIMLMTPFYVTGVSGMQIAHVVHAILAALMIAMILGHIYIGTIGMEGAFDAMGKGEVDENWAIEHHRGWYEAQRDAGRQPAPGTRPAGAD